MPQIPTLTPIANEPLTVVLLMRNATPHLGGTLGAWISSLNSQNKTYEIILVDNGSHDGSADFARPIVEQAAHVRLVTIPAPGGEGLALGAAFAEAKYPLLFYCRLDPRYQPAHLRRLLQEIDKVDVVSGYRAGVPIPIAWRVLGACWRGFTWVVFSYATPPLPGWLGWRRHFGQWLAWFFFGVLNYDVTSPIRLLRREMVANIPVQSEGSFVHIELMAKANFLGKLLSNDVPLGDRAKPVEPEKSGGDSLVRILGDAHVVFHRPEFVRRAQVGELAPELEA